MCSPLHQIEYEIRFAEKQDIHQLIRFLDENWKKDHIFVRSRKLFDWQHFNTQAKLYNFVIGVNKQTQAIHAILGFITLAQFDSAIRPSYLCWMAIWKVDETARGHKLGRCLMAFLESRLKPKIISTVGASPMSLDLYKAKGYKVGTLGQYYILNPEKTNFQLVGPSRLCHLKSYVAGSSSQRTIIEASNHSIMNESPRLFASENSVPTKSSEYLNNRYFKHPAYSYQGYKIIESSQTIAIFISRICSHQGAKSIRIVDYLGPSEALRGLSSSWSRLLTEIDAEYIDFYNVGIPEDDLCASGFTRLHSTDGIVIPNYFEPFERRNVEIHYMIGLTDNQPFRIFKGDSDQDRPNNLSI